MSIRIEVLTQKTVDKILNDSGYIFDNKHRYLFGEDNTRYKIAWIHRNSWEQVTYIDLITI